MNVRPSPLAGRWYPADPVQLKAQLQAALSPTPAATYASLYGLLAPHAGLRYSGAVAGKSFRHLQGRAYDLVVVIGPSHHAYPADLISSEHSAYRTPLGDVPVAGELLSALQKVLPILTVEHDAEHSIEMELPFLQYLLQDFELLPLAMLNQGREAVLALVQALAPLLAQRQVLLVASSDLSHFYDQASARQLDQTLLGAVEAYEPLALLRLEAARQGFACGRGAIATVMLLCQQLGARQAHIESYATSGEISGDFKRVVGYGAAVFTS